MSDPDPFKDRHLHEDEAAIENTINHLKHTDPENANREYAVGFLKFMHRFAFQAEKSNDFNYEDFFRQYEEFIKKDHSQEL